MVRRGLWRSPAWWWQPAAVFGPGVPPTSSPAAHHVGGSNAKVAGEATRSTATTSRQRSSGTPSPPLSAPTSSAPPSAIRHAGRAPDAASTSSSTTHAYRTCLDTSLPQVGGQVAGSLASSSRPIRSSKGGVCLTAAPSNEGPSPINFPGGGSPGGGSTWGPPVPTPRPQAPWGACRVFAESPGSEPEICEPWLTLSVPGPGSLKSSVAQPSAGERHHADEEDASFTSSPSRSHIEISI